MGVGKVGEELGRRGCPAYFKQLAKLQVQGQVLGNQGWLGLAVPKGDTSRLSDG